VVALSAAPFRVRRTLALGARMRFGLRLTLTEAADEGRRAVDAHVEVDLLGGAAAERAVTFVTQARPAAGPGAPLPRPAL
jgi:hypothetical protein